MEDPHPALEQAVLASLVSAASPEAAGQHTRSRLVLAEVSLVSVEAEVEALTRQTPTKYLSKSIFFE